VLASAHTILFSPEGANVSVWSSPNVFMVGSQLIQYNVLPQFLSAGKHNVAEFAADIAAAIAGAKNQQPYFTSKGDSFKVITVPLAASDFSTPCLQAKEMNADVGVGDFDTLTQFAPMSQACKQLGVNLTWALEDPVISQPVLQAVSSQGLKSVIVTAYSPKAYADLLADEAKYAMTDSNPYNEAGMDAYVGYKLLPEVIDGAGSLDVAKIKSWLQTQAAFNTQGFTPPINLTSANEPFAPYIAIKNTCAYHYTVQAGGKLAAVTATPICFKPPGTS
jgi:hypothetical protein